MGKTIRPLSADSRSASRGEWWATLDAVTSSDATTAKAAAGPSLPSAAQGRIITAALDLFARRGVGGTSLQMIADEIGVTKAAVYHQYKTKDEIILAAAETELAHLEAVITEAESEATPTQAREALVAGMIDLAVTRRRTASTILGDPVIGGFFAEHEGFRVAMRRMRKLLFGDARGVETRVQLAMLIAATSGAVIHPFVVGLDDKTLRTQLLRLTRRFLDMPI